MEEPSALASADLFVEAAKRVAVAALIEIAVILATKPKAKK